LTVGDPTKPVLRARRGHGPWGRTWLPPGGDGHQLARRVRLVQGDHLLVGKLRTRRGSRVQALVVLGTPAPCHDAVVLSQPTGHVRRPPSRRVVWWTLVLAGGFVLLVVVRMVVAPDASALAQRPLEVRHLGRSLVSLGSYPRTYVDPAEVSARVGLPAAAAFQGWLRLVGNSYYDHARPSSKPIEVNLVRRSQPPRAQLGSRPTGHLEWLFRLTSVPCLQPGYQPPGRPSLPVDRDGCDEYLFLDARSGRSSAHFVTRAGTALFMPA
jgi:hypothetical protein